MKPLSVIITLLVLVFGSSLLGGCSISRTVEIESGGYAPRGDTGETGKNTATAIQELTVDRNHEAVTFTLVDDSSIVVRLAPRELSSWPSGCPSNIGSTRMEVVNILEEPLVLGPLSISNPVLVRDCPPDPVVLVMREDGDIGGATGACPYPAECIIFEPVED